MSSRGRRRKAEEISSDSEDLSLEMSNTEDSDPLIAPESGHISHVYVENFMCHEKFSVSLGRNVNFITGQNGSGMIIKFYY